MTPVYRWKKYNISTDTEETSRRLGTLAAIQRAGGTPIDETLIMVDEALLGREIPGMTDRDFDPNRTYGGFQTKVR